MLSQTLHLRHKHADMVSPNVMMGTFHRPSHLLPLWYARGVQETSEDNYVEKTQKLDGTPICNLGTLHSIVRYLSNTLSFCHI